jgi:tetratricopeptide (TPR) repeat protein
MSDQKTALSSARNSTFNIQHSTLAAAIGVAVLAAAVYGNALANGLVWDDSIVLNRQLLAFRSLHDLLFTPRDIPQFSPDYYRPLTTLSYLIDHAIGGSSPLLFHLSVVLCHVVATFLVFRVGLTLFADTPVMLPAATLAAALFAVHPIHTESVAWGAGRSDVLACCLSLAAALAFWREDRSPLRRATVAAVLVFAAMLAKETAAAFLLILPASDWFLDRRTVPRTRPVGRAERRRQRERPSRRPPALLPYVPFAVAFVAYVLLRQTALGTLFGQANPINPGSIRTLAGAIGLYTAMLLLPLRQCAYISDVPTGPLVLLATALLLMGATGAALIAWRRRERRVSLLLLWMGLTLLPSLAIVLKIPNAPVAERYLYLPSVAFCLLCGYAAARLLEAASSGSARMVIGGLLLLLLAGGAAATVQRNTIWRSNLSLWTDTVAKNTTDGLPMRSLAAAYLDLGEREQAAEYFRLALQRRNDRLGRFTIHNNLGSLAMQEKRLADAQREYDTALAIDPNAPDALFNLGLISLTRALDTDSAHDAPWKHDQAERARQLFERALQLSPLDPDIHVALGQTLTAVGDPSGARARYQRALELGLPAPTAASVRKLLGELPASAGP